MCWAEFPRILNHLAWTLSQVRFFFFFNGDICLKQSDKPLWWLLTYIGNQFKNNSSFSITWKYFAFESIPEVISFFSLLLFNDTPASVVSLSHDFCFCLTSLIIQLSFDINDQSFQIPITLQGLTYILQLQGKLPFNGLSLFSSHGTLWEVSLIICHFVLQVFL